MNSFVELFESADAFDAADSHKGSLTNERHKGFLHQETLTKEF